MRIVAVGLLAFALLGCPSHEHNGAFMHQIDVDSTSVKAPKQDRCEAYKSAATTYSQCQQFKSDAVTYLRKLSPNDSVCLEEGFGEEPGPTCKARGTIVDADEHGMLIRVNDPMLQSKWKDYQDKRVYFENGALIDLYLRERGYE
ncbi:MAG: hypothetical protein JST54_29340 [Deltaproteobacteria bacterium]|nr:hypothetical protein [Deltaproteobacteria bacterium]